MPAAEAGMHVYQRVLQAQLPCYHRAQSCRQLMQASVSTLCASRQQLMLTNWDASGHQEYYSNTSTSPILFLVMEVWIMADAKSLPYRLSARTTCFDRPCCRPAGTSLCSRVQRTTWCSGLHVQTWQPRASTLRGGACRARARGMSFVTCHSLSLPNGIL